MLRIALLSMSEPALSGAGGVADAAPAASRAGLRIGGISLGLHQLGTVLALGCERVVCIAQTLDAELLALQQTTAQAGGRLHVINGPRGLLGLVAAGDEIVALADGLLVEPALAHALLDGGAVVLVQPVERGLDAGFERIDINEADAGAFRAPAHLVGRLADLPPDCDTFSALQRIALQAGVARREVPLAAIDDGRWRLVRSEAEAAAAEVAWIRRHTEGGGAGTSPSARLSRLFVRHFGAALLYQGQGGAIAGAAGVALALLAATLGWFGHAVAGLFLAAMAWGVFLVAEMLGRISRAGLRRPEPRVPRMLLYSTLADALLTLLIAWASLRVPGAGAGEAPADAWAALFSALMLVGLCRLVGSGPWRGRNWLHDRGLVALALALAMQVLPPLALARLAAVAVLAAGLADAARRREEANAGLTRKG